MATTRKKKTLIQGVTRETAEMAFAAYSKALAKQKKIAADIELECAAVREKYAADTEELTNDLNKNFEILEVFASENPGLFEKKKSCDMLNGTIGYRTGMPKFATDKGFTQAAVIALIKDEYPSRVEDFVKVSETLNKEAIIAESRKDESDETRMDMEEFHKACHAFVTQDETFYVASKEEDVSV